MGALRHREVLLVAIILDDEEAARFSVFGVRADLNMRQILPLVVSFIVEFEQLEHERVVSLRKLLAVLDVVQDGA